MKKLLKVSDVMERLQLGKSKVFELLATGQLESIKVGGARRVTEEAVEDFIARRQDEARATA